MPRTKYDAIRNIGELKGSYSAGVCIDCDKDMVARSEKVVDIYDIHFTCYNADADPRENRLMSLINELERLQLKAQTAS